MAMTPEDKLAAMGLDLNGIAAAPASRQSNRPDENSRVYLGAGSMGKGPFYGPGVDMSPNAQFVRQLTRGSAEGSEGMSYKDARGLPLQWMNSDPDKLKEFVNTGILRKIPGFDVGMGMPEILSAWDDMLKAAWAMNQTGNKTAAGTDWSPWDVMNTYSSSGMNFGTVRKGDWEYDIATGERLRYVGPKTKTRTDSKIDLSSPEQVQALTTQMLTELLGRAPNAEELARYKTSINAYEQANPLISTTTETYNERGEVESTSTSQSGGVSNEARGQLISTEAKKGPEYGKYQAGTTYWNALMQLIGG